MKKKILFLLPSFRKGGEAKNTLNILNALDTERFELTLFICSNENNDFKRFLEKDVRIIEIESHSSVSAFFHIIKTLRSIHPDIIFTSFIDLNFVVGIYKLFSFRRFISVLRFNTMPSDKIPSGLGFPISEKARIFSVKSADKIIAQSSEMYDKILDYYSTSKSKVEIILNAINSDQITQLALEYIPYKSYEGTTLVAVGSLWSAKGFEFLIRAVRKLKDDFGLNVRLFIVGENLVPDSDYDMYLQELINDLDLGKQVFLEGYKSNPYPYMKHADIFVLSSLKEGFPNVVLEALSLQVPCVVTDCVDFREIVAPGLNGYIVQKADVDSLVKGILKAKNIDFQMGAVVDFDYNKWFSEL